MAPEKAASSYHLLLLLLPLSESFHDACNVSSSYLLMLLDITYASECVWHRKVFTTVEQLGVTGNLLHLLFILLTEKSSCYSKRIAYALARLGGLHATGIYPRTYAVKHQSQLPAKHPQQ